MTNSPPKTLFSRASIQVATTRTPSWSSPGCARKLHGCINTNRPKTNLSGLHRESPPSPLSFTRNHPRHAALIYAARAGGKSNSAIARTHISDQHTSDYDMDNSGLEDLSFLPETEHDLPFPSAIPDQSWIDVDDRHHRQGGIKPETPPPPKKLKQSKSTEISEDDREEANQRNESEFWRKKRFDYLRKKREEFNALLVKKCTLVLKQQTKSAWFQHWSMKFTGKSDTNYNTTFNEAIDEMKRLIEIEEHFRQITVNIQNAQIAQVTQTSEPEKSREELSARIAELETKNTKAENELRYRNSELQAKRTTDARMATMMKERESFLHQISQLQDQVQQQKETIQEQAHGITMKQAEIEQLQLRVRNLNDIIAQSNSTLHQKNPLGSSLSRQFGKLSFHDIF